MLVTAQSPRGPRIANFPNLYGLIVAGRRQPSAVGTKGYIGDALRVTVQRPHQPAPFHVPEFDGRVVGRGRQTLAIRAESNAPGRHGMAEENVFNLSRRGVPNPNCAVVAGGGQPATVGTVGDLLDAAHMAGERRLLFAGRKNPSAAPSDPGFQRQAPCRRD